MTAINSPMSKINRVRAWVTRIDAPVLVQELRIRQRGIKPFVVMGVYILILSVIAMLTLYIGLGGAHTTQKDLSDTGKAVFGVLSLVQLGMIALIVPAYSAGAISGERERGTFDMLALTLMPSMSIVTQKLAAATAQALMLIAASAPVIAVVFLLGGVSPLELLMAYGLLTITAILVGGLGTLCSCCMRNSKASAFVTYLIVFAFYAGLPVIGAWFLSISSMGVDRAMGSFPWVFAGMFLFAGGVCALIVYAPLTLILHNRRVWQNRAFRISVFGGAYVILMLIMSSPRALNTAVSFCYSQGLFLPLFVNPFAALFCYVDARLGSSSSVSQAYWMVGVTAGFSLGAAYLFRHIASVRFALLRRSK